MAIPERILEQIRLDPRNTGRTWIEDVEIRVPGCKPMYFSFEVTRELDLDGNVRITAIHNYADLQDQIWDFLEQVLESDR